MMPWSENVPRLRPVSDEVMHDTAGSLMDQYGNMRDRRDTIVLAAHAAGYRAAEISRRMRIHPRTARGIIRRNDDGN
jgi:hypothetical protein